MYALTVNKSHKTIKYCYIVIVFFSVVMAFISCQDHAGSWNDGSRLATVHTLVDERTFIIDHSLFITPPEQLSLNPYRDSALQKRGSQDKLQIHQHYYSDKSPVPALMMALEYFFFKKITGYTATSHPFLFCYVMTLLSSGIAYLVSLMCLFALSEALPLGHRLALTASLGLCTMLICYVQYVNNHIFLLAVSLSIITVLSRVVKKQQTRQTTHGELLLLGCLGGIGYSIDMGAGPLLLVCLMAWMIWRIRDASGCLLVMLAACPWVILHHVVNYTIAGVWAPANSVSTYLTWPGSPFNSQNMTGHLYVMEHPLKTIAYSFDLLFGKKGFFGHNLPLLLLFPGIMVLCRSKIKEMPELLFALGWSVAVWLLYALTSNNHSGVCISIRWFVPLLAPGFFMLILVLRERPQWFLCFVILSLLGFLLGAWMWYKGPWFGHVIPYYWPVYGMALLSVGLRRREMAMTRIPLS